MLTNEERQKWAAMALSVDRSVYEGWMREIHGEILEVAWHEDCEELPVMTFIASETLMCHLSLCSPPEWVVFRVCCKCLIPSGETGRDRGDRETERERADFRERHAAGDPTAIAEGEQ